jgi:hypothetical protein
MGIYSYGWDYLAISPAKKHNSKQNQSFNPKNTPVTPLLNNQGRDMVSEIPTDSNVVPFKPTPAQANQAERSRYPTVDIEQHNRLEV